MPTKKLGYAKANAGSGSAVPLPRPSATKQTDNSAQEGASGSTKRKPLAVSSSSAAFKRGKSSSPPPPPKMKAKPQASAEKKPESDPAQGNETKRTPPPPPITTKDAKAPPPPSTQTAESTTPPTMGTQSGQTVPTTPTGEKKPTADVKTETPIAPRPEENASSNTDTTTEDTPGKDTRKKYYDETTHTSDAPLTNSAEKAHLAGSSSQSTLATLKTTTVSPTETQGNKEAEAPLSPENENSTDSIPIQSSGTSVSVSSGKRQEIPVTVDSTSKPSASSETKETTGQIKKQEHIKDSSRGSGHGPKTIENTSSTTGSTRGVSLSETTEAISHTTNLITQGESRETSEYTEGSALEIQKAGKSDHEISSTMEETRHQTKRSGTVSVSNPKYMGKRQMEVTSLSGLKDEAAITGRSNRAASQGDPRERLEPQKHTPQRSHSGNLHAVDEEWNEETSLMSVELEGVSIPGMENEDIGLVSSPVSSRAHSTHTSSMNKPAEMKTNMNERSTTEHADKVSPMRTQEQESPKAKIGGEYTQPKEQAVKESPVRTRKQKEKPKARIRGDYTQPKEQSDKGSPVRTLERNESSTTKISGEYTQPKEQPDKESPVRTQEQKENSKATISGEYTQPKEQFDKDSPVRTLERNESSKTKISREYTQPKEQPDKESHVRTQEQTENSKATISGKYTFSSSCSEDKLTRNTTTGSVTQSISAGDFTVADRNSTEKSDTKADNYETEGSGSTIYTGSVSKESLYDPTDSLKPDKGVSSDKPSREKISVRAETSGSDTGTEVASSTTRTMSRISRHRIDELSPTATSDAYFARDRPKVISHIHGSMQATGPLNDKGRNTKVEKFQPNYRQGYCGLSEPLDPLLENEAVTYSTSSQNSSLDNERSKVRDVRAPSSTSSRIWSDRATSERLSDEAETIDTLSSADGKFKVVYVATLRMPSLANFCCIYHVSRWNG